MRVTYCAGCIVIILLFSGITVAEDAATIHGVAYEWDTFVPLDNTIIQVNSTPSQSMVSKYGVYSFELPRGTYCITASYYEDDQLTYYGEDVITVLDEGNYVVDLLLLPSYSNVVVEEDIYPAKVRSSVSLLIVSLVIVLILLVSLFYQIRKKPQKDHFVKGYDLGPATSVCAVKVSSKEGKYTCPVRFKPKIQATKGLHANLHKDKYAPISLVCETGPMSSEHQEIIDILRLNGGTMAQKDLRKFLDYSEGKVCVMVIDLEKRGKIQKVRKGRGNILFLTESGK